MEEFERGRLYPMKADGSEMAPVIIKKSVLYIGSGDSCGIRIYTDGIYPEHCALTTGKKGRVYFEPLHPTALALVNHDKITKKCLLKQDDVITILVKSFRFAYPVNSVHSQISVKIPILPSVVMKTISPKHRISSTRKSVSPKGTVLPNNDNLHILQVKRRMTGIAVEQNVQKKKKLSICEKRVRFGPKLAPEEFDKLLPPSSPLRRGSLPGETNSQSILKHRLSSQLSPNILKRKRVNAKRLSSTSKRSSFPFQSAKMCRGSPLVDKSLNITNDSSTTLTVNVEVHSGPKSKIETPLRSMPSHKRSISFTSMEYGDFEGTSPNSMPLDDITKIFDSSVSKNSPPKFDESSSNLKIQREFCDTSCISAPEDIANISQSPISKKTFLKSDRSTASVSSAVDKRPLFSEILKKHKAHPDKVPTVSMVKSLKLSACLKKSSKYLIDDQKCSEQLIHRQILAVGSTGHANSPDTIILRKRKVTEVHDISDDVTNVRRSPRTPRRAKCNMVIRETSEKVEELQSEFCCTAFLDKLPEGNVKQYSKETPIQPRNNKKFEKEIFKKHDSQLKDMCSVKTDEVEGSAFTMLPQHIDNTAAEEVEKKIITKVTTPPEAFSNLALGKTSKKKEDVQLECTGVVFGKIYEEGLEQDTRATPNQLRKDRKSGGVEFIKKQDSQFDDLCNIETNGISTERNDFQSDSNACASFGKVQKELEKREVIVSSTQSRSSGNEIIEKQDSHYDNLDNDENVKDIKKRGNKQPRRGRKLQQVSKENKDEKLNNLIEPGKYTESSSDPNPQKTSSMKTEDVKETKKTMNQSRKGRKLLQVPQENKDRNLDDLTTQSEYSENIRDLKSPLIDSPSNEKENEDSLKLKGKKSVKRSRNKKVANVLNENEEIQLKKDLSDLGQTSKKTIDLKSRSPDDVSVQRTTQKAVKTIKNIDKPLPKRRNVKKDCSAGEELKSSAHELSPCRRVTRSMAKKFVPN